MLPTSLPGGPPTCASRVTSAYPDSAAVDDVPLARHPAHGVDEHPALGDLDPLVEGLDGVVVLDRYGGLLGGLAMTWWLRRSSRRLRADDAALDSSA